MLPASVCLLGLWVLALPTGSRGFSVGVLALPLALSVLTQDWLVRQSISLWLDTLRPFAPILALWLCVEAVYLVRARCHYRHVLLPGPWVVLLYWQLLCLQSGMLSWPFLMQLFGIALLMIAVIMLGHAIVRDGRLQGPAQMILAVMQWLLALLLTADMPQQRITPQVDAAEVGITLGVLLCLALVGVILEILRLKSYRGGLN